MGKLQQIINEINGPSFATEIQKKLPIDIQKKITDFYPSFIDYDLIIRSHHQDKRNLITTGAFVPIPYALTILPIFIGGKDSDSMSLNEKKLNLFGSKEGLFSVNSLGVSSDLCFYTFCFLLQMSIFRKTSLLYIDLPYLCEFLGWKNNTQNKKRISTIIERLSSVQFEGNYSGIFKKNKKRENLVNLFKGELIKSYYIDIEKDSLIINISESISNLFAMDKVWYGIDLIKYSKIPTGHAKSLALYIGGKSRGLDSIEISNNELLERLCINNLKSDKQKNKIIKDSFTTLLDNKIISNFKIQGIGSRRNILVNFNKKENYFCFSKNSSQKSISSLKCHSAHFDKEANIELKSIYLKIIKFHELNSQISVYDKSKSKVIKENIEKQNLKFNQIKINKSKKQNKIAVFDDRAFNNLKEDMCSFISEQSEYYNKHEEMFTNILNGQIDSMAIFAESLNDVIESSLVNNILKTNLQKKLFEFIDNNSINVGSAIKKSKIPYIKLSNGNIKLKRFNSENYNELKGLEKISMKDLLIEKTEYSSLIFDNGLISEYDYKKLSSSKKPLIKNKDNLKTSILVEGTNTFWFSNEKNTENKIELSSSIAFENKEDFINEYGQYLIDFKNIIQDINDDEIILKGKIPVFDGEEKVEILTIYDFKKYIEQNKVSLSQRKIGNLNTLILEKTIGKTCKKISLSDNQDFCNYSDLNYRKEYQNLRDSYIDNIERGEDFSYTLNDSNKLKVINKVRDMHLSTISDFNFVNIEQSESKIDFNDLFDTDDLFDTIEFENIPDRI